MNERELVLEARDVSYSYDGKTDVLSDVSLSVYRGDYVGLIGPNGGGKTTLLKLMLNLLKPDRGSVALLGNDIRRFKEWHRIGYVSQRAIEFDLLFPVTVEEVVLMGCYARRGLFQSTSKNDLLKAHEALRQVGMFEFRARRISDLSGGQKQRVFLARALASSPYLIVLDEPTTGIDRESEEQFYALLKDLNMGGMTLLLVSHDLDRVAREASCVAVVDHTLRYYGDPKEAVTLEHRSDFHH